MMNQSFIHIYIILVRNVCETGTPNSSRLSKPRQRTCMLLVFLHGKLVGMSTSYVFLNNQEGRENFRIRIVRVPIVFRLNQCLHLCICMSYKQAPHSTASCLPQIRHTNSQRFQPFPNQLFRIVKGSLHLVEILHILHNFMCLHVRFAK